MLDEASQPPPRRTSTTPGQPTDNIDRIDALIDVCGHCGRDLAADNASMDFCSENCQMLWNGPQSDELLPIYPLATAERIASLLRPLTPVVRGGNGEPPREPPPARRPLAPAHAPQARPASMQ